MRRSLLPLPRRRVGRPAGVLAALLLALTGLLAVGAATGAQAASGYRYWSYYHVQDGDYAFAKTGADGYTPKDGSTEAYRYGTSTNKQSVTPRADLSTYTFDRICRGTKATSGQKRVAVIIDYGVPADAASGQTPPDPRTACAAVPTDANGQQVLQSVADVRVDQFICGIDGYPTTGCSMTVKDATPQQGTDVAFTAPQQSGGSGSGGSATGQSASQHDGNGSGSAAASSSSQEDSGGFPGTLVGAIVVVVLLGLGALVLARRNRSTD